MSITAADVNNLRKKTGAGLMDCKKALTESNGDLEGAIDYLRKKGQKLSDKRADREATEGVVIAVTSENGKIGYAVNVSCETDFVAKNDEFISFAMSIVDIAKSNDVKNIDELLAQDFEGQTVQSKITEQVGKIGEKVQISKYERIEGEMVIPYIHAGYKLGVLVSLNEADNNGIEQAGKDVAMQIAAMNPIAVDEDGVPAEVVQREKEIGMELARNEGKPDAIVEKIALGKVQKFFKDNTLVHQPFVKDNSKTVGQMLKDLSPALKVNSFKRLTLS